MLPPKLKLLDPRPAEDAARRPIADAVNIPLSELSNRMHELPSKNAPILVEAEEPLLSEALQFLTDHGRQAVASEDWQYGGPSPGRLWEPNAFLLEHLPEMTPGTALDLACGTGRDAVAMAAYEWSVLAVDQLQDALDRGAELARRYLSAEEAKNIEWRQMDLEKQTPSGSFDLITMFFYLDRDLLRKMGTHLRPGGRMMIETFTGVHREKIGKPRREHLVLRPNELPALLPGLQIEHYDEEWRDGRHTVRALLKSP